MRVGNGRIVLFTAGLSLALLGLQPAANGADLHPPATRAEAIKEKFASVEVSDPNDGHIAHLHGLNLSRAWCFRRLAAALPNGDPRAPVMLAAAERHAAASLDQAVDSNYHLEHWLAAYAVLYLGEGAG